MALRLLAVERAAAPRVAPMQQLTPRIFNTYNVWILFDVMMVSGTIVLLLCYAWARSLGHVGTFCDISDLVVHLPERVVFRLNFSLLGTSLAALAFPIHDVVASRLTAAQSTLLPKVAAAFQLVAGVGIVLVGACGPEEILLLHYTAAFMGFGGGGTSQMLYNVILFREERSPAQTLFVARCVISLLFLSSAALFTLGECRVLPEPWEHVFEWGMYFTIIAWYFTFRWDLSTFRLASMEFEGRGKLRCSPLLTTLPIARPVPCQDPRA